MLTQKGKRTRRVSVQVAGDRDVVRIAPCRAAWRCDCGVVTTIYANHSLTIGNIWGRLMSCRACPLIFRGRYITGPHGQH